MRLKQFFLNASNQHLIVQQIQAQLRTHGIATGQGQSGGAGPQAHRLIKGNIIEQAEEIYTTDGVDALRLLYDDLHQPPWSGLSMLPAEDDTTDEGNSLTDRSACDE